MITSAGAYLGRYLIDKQSAQFQGTNQKQETLASSAINDPERLLLARSAIHMALGMPDPHTEILLRVLQSHGKWAQFDQMIRTGTFCVGQKRFRPKNACYWSHCGETYVWVIPGHESALSDLTLVILDILTIDSTKLEAPAYKIGVTKLDEKAHKIFSTNAGAKLISQLQNLGYLPEAELRVKVGQIVNAIPGLSAEERNRLTDDIMKQKVPSVEDVPSRRLIHSVAPTPPASSSVP